MGDNLVILLAGISGFLGYLCLMGGIAEYRRIRSIRKRYGKICGTDVK